MEVAQNDLNAECAVLSAMIVDSNIIAKAMTQVRRVYFYYPKNRTIFDVIVELYGINMGIDIVTLLNLIKKKGLMSKVGGEEYLYTVEDLVMTGAHFDYHLRILVDCFQRREALRIGQKLIESMNDGKTEIKDVYKYAHDSLYGAAGIDMKNYTELPEAIRETLLAIQELSVTGGKRGVSSSFYDLDHIINGFIPGQFIVIAARPSIGKSSIALNIIINTLKTTEISVALHSLETKTTEVMMRMISQESGVPLDRIIHGYGIRQEQIRKIMDATDGFEGKKLYIDDSAINTASIIRSKIRAKKMSDPKLGLAVVDYMQLLTDDSKSENRERSMNESSKTLKQTANESNIPIIALAQFNRELDKRENQKPRLSDLRESGAIEQDADMVIALWKDPKIVKEEATKNVVNVTVLKNRHGKTGELQLLFFPEYTRFENYSGNRIEYASL